ncbi:DUF3536 domain-containing protein [Oceanispirochaeta crateris]|uniref:DUF3536 domain-containing protein n=1 Tax=Oceanispirochaeta crateris TaxID=2518645 RepID=A0A5C1QID8_9SPIO|nr:DUF3536 domain-containing protein [Oceanispirochaeta crateris]QEN07913.1 DUF3536 domain-containing protein [Oceanispirochaeta crateris]
MRNLIIHGHFYQPPRENPWTGIIEDQKESAPYPNWNSRINSECYEANAFSPLLNAKGNIESFFNNYRYISYNIGPTLLNWLQEESPHVYEKIIEGDKLSIEDLGFGNAIAQVYNHMILPLANEHDRRTQILWGLENFKSHYGRDSEGLWLSEAAINKETAEDLVKAGVKYTILSPWQAQRFRFEASGWEDATGDSQQLWQHPWRLNCPSGDLTIFFYHPHLSSEISFNHLLRDADYFYNRVTKELDNSGATILPIATDGEIYGHHELLGNMGLSAFLSKVQRSQDSRLVNFSWLNSNASPAGQVELKDGEDGRGSSWSCSHGVSRWYKDCGCSTGGQEEWNQAWRGPLREALRDLQASSDRIYKAAMPRLSSSSAQEIRDQYVHVLTKRIPKGDFFRRYCPSRSSESDQQQFFRLLEGQKFSMLMFTSCAWFFSDISGVEPLQNLMYAARLIDLYSPFYSNSPESAFLEKLSMAHSNIPEKGNGAVLYTMSKYLRKKEINQSALSFIIMNYYGIKEDTPGFLRGEIEPEKNEDLQSRKSGILTLTHPLTGEKNRIPYFLEGEERLFSSITLYPGDQNSIYTPEDISRRDKESLMKQLCLMELGNHLSISKKYSGIINQLDEWMKLRLPDGENLKHSIKALLHYAFREVTFLMESGNAEGWNCFLDLQEKNKIWKIPLPEDLNLWLNRIIDRKLLHKDQILNALKSDINSILNQLIILLEVQQISSRMTLSSSLSGRIFDLVIHNKEGQILLEKADGQIKKKLLNLLNLTEDIQLSPSEGF